jgi:iron complex transport system substrate-binding protein
VPRIVSFLPAGTEIVHALGAGADLVGRSHECDYPDGVEELPVVSRPALPLDGMSQGEIDRAVADRLASGESLYQVDEALLDRLAPDILITQDLCQVCAPSGNELSRAIRDLRVTPRVLWLTPQTVADIEENIRSVGEAIGRADEASRLIEENRDRMAAVAEAVADAPVRRVAFLEWTSPFFCAGHWVPEMIAIAGGHDPLGRPGSDSVRITWEEIEEHRPEIILVSPCGYRLEQAIELASTVPYLEEAQLVAVDANAYFARPGPRVAEGIELLAHLFHPELVDWEYDFDPFAFIG